MRNVIAAGFVGLFLLIGVGCHGGSHEATTDIAFRAECTDADHGGKPWMGPVHTGPNAYDEAQDDAKNHSVQTGHAAKVIQAREAE